LGDKAVSTIFDNSKIKRFVPEFTATTRFKQGILKTIEWFEEKPERMLVNPDTDNFIDHIIKSYAH
jgi:hypothetical protein